jgi:hypothetical protein
MPAALRSTSGRDRIVRDLAQQPIASRKVADLPRLQLQRARQANVRSTLITAGLATALGY